MSKSNDLEGKILKHILGGPDYTRLGTVFVALYSESPGETGTATTNELSGAGYARVSVTNDGASWSDDGQVSGSYQLSNANELNFPIATDAWVEATHFAIVSSASGAGDILYYGALTTPKTVQLGDIARFEAGQLQIQED